MKKIVAVLLVIFCAGCISLKYQQRTQYMLHVNMPQKTKVKKFRRKILEINNVAIAPQFANLSFVYRLNKINYLRDYYHIFFNSPAEQINQLLVQYIRSLHLFSYVSNDVSLAQADYILRVDVIKLYADYRTKPKAVVAMHCVLYAPGTKMKILMNKTFSAHILLRHRNSRALVYAWNQGLQKIFRQLTNAAFKT